MGTLYYLLLLIFYTGPLEKGIDDLFIFIITYLLRTYLRYVIVFLSFSLSFQQRSITYVILFTALCDVFDVNRCYLLIYTSCVYSYGSIIMNVGYFQI